MTTGFLLVDKPQGFTSHDIVSIVRRALGERRVGHAGTLDPAATGLLVLGVGRSTRLLTFLVGADKRYEAVIRLGMSTDTDDAEGRVVQRAGAGHVSDLDVESGIPGFIGRISQTPSTVSAIKVAGKPAHRRVRDGESVQLSERNVTIHSFELDSITRSAVDDVNVVDASVRVHVSSGTYVRALARDLGQRLGSGGHLVHLRRTSVGPFQVGEGFTGIADLARRRGTADRSPDDRSGTDLQNFLLSAESVARQVLPAAILDEDAAIAVLHGQRIPTGDRATGDRATGDRATGDQGTGDQGTGDQATGDQEGVPTALISESGSLLAVAVADEGMWRYRVVVGEPPPKV